MGIILCTFVLLLDSFMINLILLFLNIFFYLLEKTGDMLLCVWLQHDTHLQWKYLRIGSIKLLIKEESAHKNESWARICDLLPASINDVTD